MLEARGFSEMKRVPLPMVALPSLGSAGHWQLVSAGYPAWSPVLQAGQLCKMISAPELPGVSAEGDCIAVQLFSPKILLPFFSLPSCDPESIPEESPCMLIPISASVCLRTQTKCPVICSSVIYPLLPPSPYSLLQLYSPSSLH